MNSRFYNFMILAMVSLFLVLVSSCRPQASGEKPVVQSDALMKSEVSGKAAAEEVKVSSAVPHIKFDKLVHDFCDISPDSINNCTFGFTNTGTGVLEITQTKGTCKCTVPELKKKDYAAGESGEVSVEFHAPKYQGPTSQNIYVFTNDPNNSKVELAIEAHVQSQVQVTPETMSLSLLDSNAGAVAVTLKSLDGERFAVTGINSEGGVFTVDFDPNNISDAHTLYPKVNIDNLRKCLDGYLTIELNHPACKSVRVQYSCLKEFEASPSVIIIRDAVIGEVQKRTMYLTSNYNEDITVESVTSDKGIIKVVGQKKTESKFEFDVEVVPPAKEGKSRVFFDTLHIKIKDKEQFDIPCRGFYKLGQ